MSDETMTDEEWEEAVKKAGFFADHGVPQYDAERHGWNEDMFYSVGAGPYVVYRVALQDASVLDGAVRVSRRPRPAADIREVIHWRTKEQYDHFVEVWRRVRP